MHLLDPVKQQVQRKLEFELVVAALADHGVLVMGGSHGNPQDMRIVLMGAAWAINLGVAEYYIRRRSLPTRRAR